MSSIRALIVDDEPLARRGIRQLLATHADVAVVGECRDGREALHALAAQQPDLVFLDVEMPGLDGMRLIDVRGAERMPLIVFVTAHEEFAVRAFDAQAVDYLVKPLSRARFDTMMTRVRHRFHERQGSGRIAVPDARGEKLVETSDIDWIEAQDDYVVIHAQGREHRLRQPLRALEQRLEPGRFVRAHRATLVRVDRIRELRAEPSGAGVLVLRDGTQLAVSRRRLAQVRAKLRA